MIRLDRVELLHWDVQEHQVLPLASGVTLITGENGSGKTAILDAIKVGLGARLEGERNARSYLLKQARPVAMIRIVADNRPTGRRRPFDPLHGPASDQVSLVVLFRQREENDYDTAYFILDGDRSPLENPGGKKRPEGAMNQTEYRERLEKVGIGRRYLRLVCLPQGQIASLCKKSGGDLFDDLFDIIGGRSTLETWNDRLRELQEQRRQMEATRKDLEQAKRGLELLDTRVTRHFEYIERGARHAALRVAIPHARHQEAREKQRRLQEQVQRQDHEIASLEVRHREALAQETACLREIEELGLLRETLVQETGVLDKEYASLVLATGALNGQMSIYESLRQAAEGVPTEDVDSLEAEIREIELAELHETGEARRREETLRDQRRDLATVEKGLFPFPPEVEAFRARLRAEGIPHHLLAEVLEIRDTNWRKALEAWLGRHRLAVLVQDPETWPRAAALARELGYQHGVLAPDVRGHSPADREGLLSLLEVREPRYRALLARLLRGVEAGEPAVPLQTPRQGQILAQDGFTLSRVEARVAFSDQAWLGRAALEERREALRARVRELTEENLRSKGLIASLTERLTTARARLDAQQKRLEWERVREAWESTGLALAQATAMVQAKQAEMQRARARERELYERSKPLQQARGAASERARTAREERSKVEKERTEAQERLTLAERELASVQEIALQPASPEVLAVLAEGSAPLTMENEARRLQDELARYTAEERDNLLPVNVERQRGEVQAVEDRLGHLKTGLEKTQAAADEARQQYHVATRSVFRSYFSRLRAAAEALDFTLEGRLEPRDDARFSCEIRVRVGEKAPVQHNSEDLSGGQKAALSILMGMTAVSLENEGAGFFLIDEPFAATDVHKINELGEFLARTQAQYLLSMPTSADLERCGTWLGAIWSCTRSRGGSDERGRPALAPRVKLCLLAGSRDV